MNLAELQVVLEAQQTRINIAKNLKLNTVDGEVDFHSKIVSPQTSVIEVYLGNDHLWQISTGTFEAEKRFLWWVNSIGSRETRRVAGKVLEAKVIRVGAWHRICGRMRNICLSEICCFFPFGSYSVQNPAKRRFHLQVVLDINKKG